MIFLLQTAGRRTVYIVSFTFFVVWIILAAVSDSISMPIVMRVLSQGAAPSVQAIGAGIIADIWAVHERGTAMGVFLFWPVGRWYYSGICSGRRIDTVSWWRSTQRCLAIYGYLVLVLILFCLLGTLEARLTPSSGVPSRAPMVEKQPGTHDLPASVANQTDQMPTPSPPSHVFRLRSILLSPFKIITASDTQPSQPRSFSYPSPSTLSPYNPYPFKTTSLSHPTLCQPSSSVYSTSPST